MHARSAINFRGVIESATEADLAMLNFSDHPQYPSYIIALTEGDLDGYWFELLQRVAQWDKHRIKAGAEQGEELLWPEQRPTRLSSLKAVYRVDGSVCQIQHGRSTGPKRAVGRIGVVDILQQRLQKLTGQKFSFVDVTELIEGQPSESMEKFLRSMNSGNNVTLKTVSRVAERLRLDPASLVLFSRQLYSVRAATDHRKSVKEFLDRRFQKIRNELQFYRVDLKRISPGLNFDFIESLLRLNVPRTQIDWKDFPSELDKARAAEALIDVLRTTERRNPQAIEVIHERLRALEQIGVAAWGGSYEAPYAIVPEDPKEGSRYTRRWVVAFGPVAQARNSIIVDRSSELNLGPDVDD